ncbi:matrixin family metalloprotease [Candidatus Obscuribacterales bacterium]|nr:matrixin family metalloprotease [Candidatus Obscuribacterales bacterium]
MTGKLLSKRLIKAAVVSLALLSQGFPFAAVGQTNRLPKAGFQRFSGNLPPSNSGAGIGSITGTGLSTPGVHLTSGMDRTPRNAREPYNPGEPTLNMALVRWQREKMPLRIWISPGLQLPQIPFEQLPSTRVETVFQMLQQENPFSDLSQADGWSESVNQSVAMGIEQWRQFENEGLLRFGFTSDPRTAHVLVFFTDQFQGAAGPGGTNVGALTCAQLFTPQQTQMEMYRQKPVIMEFSTRVNHLPEKMQGSAAHEFGHALGIKAHSPYRDDIMYENNVVYNLSEGDKATIRLLYRAEPKYVM